MRPDKPTAPEQWTVITWALAIILVLMGVTTLWLSFNDPDARTRGFVCIGLAIAVVGSKRLIDYIIG